MFNLFKKKPSSQEQLGLLHTDVHSHLLPGIDDGSPDLETSIQLITELKQLGYKKLVTTPHILWDMYKNDRESILRREELVKDELIKRNIDIQFKAAAEYYVDGHFSQLLNQRIPLLTLYEDWVLIEFSFVSLPFDLKQNLFQMQLSGYRPVIAHPERYSYFHRDKEKYHEFAEQGYILQVNLLSLTGYYGKQIQDAANYLVKNKLVSLLGTDLHHTRHLAAINNDSLFRRVKQVMEECEILNAYV
ncbi:MAG TPA: CpsB/CapC family capsule biosynthesis tyrosine phosphatase [Chitinophagaceae bacterium]|nr:CpsB/CapC family capsule biosynthesis tyrosine phosphatase [Chitinophagaceae bacterium]